MAVRPVLGASKGTVTANEQGKILASKLKARSAEMAKEVIK
jgi:hypothetical protein